MAKRLHSQSAKFNRQPQTNQRPNQQNSVDNAGVIGLVIGYTIFRAQALNSLELNQLPLLGKLTVAINALNFNLANPLLYVVLPMLLLLCLGARPAELGLSLPNTRTDWNRIGLLIFIMGFINLSYLSVSFVLGGFSPATLGRRLLTNLHFNPF